MRIRFLGRSTANNGSPTILITDRGTYIVQGWRVPGRDDRIEIPHDLLAFLERGTCLGVKLEDTGHGTFMLSGAIVSDLEVLARMEVPGNELCIEVPAVQVIRPDGLQTSLVP